MGRHGSTTSRLGDTASGYGWVSIALHWITGYLFSIPSPMGAHHALRDFLHWVHATSAAVIFAGFLLHLGGVYKHAAFDQDGTLGKMLVPPAE
jgi:cytochrome b561